MVLATPHSQHAAQIAQAAAAGKHILVEKPITLDHASAVAAAEAARKAGVTLAVGYCRRFHPSFVEIRERLRDGRLGKIVGLVAQHTTSTQTFIAPDNWRADPDEAPAGAMTAVGLHALDLMIEFAGRVRDVQCVTGLHGDGPADDTTTVLMRFASGATGAIFCSVATATNFSFAAYGTGGLAEVRGAALQHVPLRADVAAGADRPGAGAARPDRRPQRLQHAARRARRIRARDPRQTPPTRSASTTCCTAWRCSTPACSRPRPAASSRSSRARPPYY